MRTPASDRIVIAVSILDNETGDAQYDRLVTDLSDLVVAHLTELDSSRPAVIGNAAVLRQPRNIRNLKAVEAGVKADYVVLGQLQRADKGYRFITHLIRLRDETHLKANRLQRPDGMSRASKVSSSRNSSEPFGSTSSLAPPRKWLNLRGLFPEAALGNAASCRP